MKPGGRNLNYVLMEVLSLHFFRPFLLASEEPLGGHEWRAPRFILLITSGQRWGRRLGSFQAAGGGESQAHGSLCMAEGTCEPQGREGFTTAPGWQRGMCPEAGWTGLGPSEKTAPVLLEPVTWKHSAPLS